ncbi:MAG: hypothetical protein ACJAXA_000272 [Candidatus Aldehydirespiratoraceae bacterium]|jgi:hypothetical protein
MKKSSDRSGAFMKGPGVFAMGVAHGASYRERLDVF